MVLFLFTHLFIPRFIFFIRNLSWILYTQMVENARKKYFAFYKNNSARTSYENKQKSLENIGLSLYNDRRYVTF